MPNSSSKFGCSQKYSLLLFFSREYCTRKKFWSFLVNKILAHLLHFEIWTIAKWTIGILLQSGRKSTLFHISKLKKLAWFYSPMSYLLAANFAHTFRKSEKLLLFLFFFLFFLPLLFLAIFLLEWKEKTDKRGKRKMLPKKVKTKRGLLVVQFPFL